jgi:hypothetical protein
MTQRESFNGWRDHYLSEGMGPREADLEARSGSWLPAKGETRRPEALQGGGGRIVCGPEHPT